MAALFILCTLKRTPEPSNTQGLIDASARVMAKQGVSIENIRTADHDIATGMTGHGPDSDAWPQISQQVLAADILVLAGPSGSATTGDNRRQQLGDETGDREALRILAPHAHGRGRHPCPRKPAVRMWRSAAGSTLTTPTIVEDGRGKARRATEHDGDFLLLSAGWVCRRLSQ